ncbi:uncharacterized protein IL334_002882 [Kwoniella shivajii]|uniref:Flavin reductase like domain-containing protein n=1 Tax=Kwoniella shivajii TaxID=564305 RepID=A0ABZ1CZ02_9TREE|nr:hypothetical protein IL334_002882 [Kwoniella shivajii]
MSDSYYRNMHKHRPFKDVESEREDFDISIQPQTTKVPEPNFIPGQGLNNLPYSKDFEAKQDGFKSIIPEEQEKSDIYKMMISGITPRPIAFVSTMDENGNSNLAPMSYFNAVGHNPPTIMISITGGKHEDGWKDTNHNIKTTKEFCVSIISEPFLEAANYTAVDAPADISEWALSGLTQRPSETIKPPHVAESAFSMECTLEHFHELIGDEGKPTHSVVLGRIKRFQVKEFVLDPNDPFKVMTEKLRPMSRLGGITYSRTTQMVEVPRPVWDQVKDTDEVKAALAKGVKKV